MLVELRSVADRLVWEGALVAHLADSVPGDALERRTDATGWTVRQTISHLGLANHRHADVLVGIVETEARAGDALPSVDDQADAPLDHLLEQLAMGRARLYELLECLGPGDMDRLDHRDRPLAVAIPYWAGHYADHALDIVETVPEVRMDSLVLTWLLGVDYEADGRPELAERQRRLVAAVREQLAREREAS